MSEVKNLFKNSSWMMTSQLVTSICGFVWTILIARYLGASDFGILSFAISFSSIMNILLDLGVSSYQLDEKSRGFSYIGENELDMRMDKTQELTAKEVINNYEEEKLANIIYEYGEERFSRKIARNICIERKEKPITTTKQLVEIIEKSIPKSK